MADTILQISELAQNGHGLTAYLLTLSPGAVDDLHKEKFPEMKEFKSYLTANDLSSRKFDSMMGTLKHRLEDHNDAKMTLDRENGVITVSAPAFRAVAIQAHVDGYLAGWRDARFA